MIFLQLFYTFLIVGAFTFGGGYSMIALIQDEVVVRHGWLSMNEFADLLAISQTTPGPIGINTATYSGYMAVLNAGYSQGPAAVGALISSIAVIFIPVILVMFVSKWLISNRNKPVVSTTMKTIRLTVVGLIAAAALGLITKDTFGLDDRKQMITSIAIFLVVLFLSIRKTFSPILLILASGVVGLVVYSS